MKKNNPFVIAEILMIAILVIIAPVLISSGAYVYVPEEITGLLMLISVLVSLIVIISTPPPFFRRKRVVYIGLVWAIIGIETLSCDLQNDYIMTYPKLNGVAYTERDTDRSPHLLSDGDYLLGDINNHPYGKYLSIVKKDQIYTLNIRFFSESKRVSAMQQYIKIQPFHSDYIENDITTEADNPNILSGIKNYYFLHVENGYGVIFQKVLDIPYTADRTELVFKIHDAALKAGYITE